MSIRSDIRDRIYASANKLYEEAGREKFPTVTSVRRDARVDMNDAQAVMLDWRKQQTAKVTPVAVAIPEGVQDAFKSSLALAWVEAQDKANEELAHAQSSWEAERKEFDSLRQEISQAYDELNAQYEETLELLKTAQANLEQSETANHSLQEQLAQREKELNEEKVKHEQALKTGYQLGKQLEEAKQLNARQFDQLSAQINEEKQKNTALSATIAKHEQREEIAQNEHARLVKEQGDLSNKLATVQKEKEVSLTENARLAGQLEGGQAELGRLLEQNKQFQEELLKLAKTRSGGEKKGQGKG